MGRTYTVLHILDVQHIHMYFIWRVFKFISNTRKKKKNSTRNIDGTNEENDDVHESDYSSSSSSSLKPILLKRINRIMNIRWNISSTGFGD